MTTVAVPERGHVVLSRPVWDRLESSEGFARLLDGGVVEATVLPGRGVRLRGACYVGRAQCGEFAVELREKIDGALVSLIGHATHDAFRMERLDAPASELGDLAALLVHQFLAAVTAYASRGRQFRYTTERRTGSLVGGRLDITKSIQLRARGLGHLLVFEKQAISHRTPTNRVVLAALREVESLKDLVAIPASDLARARGLAMLFADCRDAEVLFGKRSGFVDLAHALVGSDLLAADRDMLALASVILAHESFEASPQDVAAVPRAWFLNLESLFEAAVRNVLADVMGPAHPVTRGSAHGRRVFATVAGEYAAYPDLVVGGSDGFQAIGDVKYKEWGGGAGAADVYQLLAHASAFGCRRAFLVYPSDRYEVRRMGEAATGCEVTLFTVDVRHLRRDVDLLAGALGLVRAAPRDARTRTDTPALR